MHLFKNCFFLWSFAIPKITIGHKDSGSIGCLCASAIAWAYAAGATRSQSAMTIALITILTVSIGIALTVPQLPLQAARSTQKFRILFAGLIGSAPATAAAILQLDSSTTALLLSVGLVQIAAMTYSGAKKLNDSRFVSVEANVLVNMGPAIGQFEGEEIYAYIETLSGIRFFYKGIATSSCEIKAGQILIGERFVYQSTAV